MPDGSIVISAEIDDKKAQQELNRLNRRIQTLNDQIYVKQQQRMPLVEQAQQLGAELDTAKATLDQMQRTPGNFNAASVQEQQETVRALQAEWNRVQSQVERYDRSIQQSTLNLNLAKERAGEIQQNMARTGPAARAMSDAMDRMEKSAQRFSSRLREVIRSALIFTVISQALASLREWMGRVIETNKEASAAFARLRGALLTLAQPLIEVIIPALTTFANLLVRIVQTAAGLVSAMFGTTVAESAEAAEGLYNEMEAIEGVGEAADDAGKSLASFDTINKLSSTDTAGAGGGAAGSIEPNFDTSFISGALDEIMNILGAAALAIGAVLTFSGANIPVGLGLMAAGALVLGSAVAENWGYIVTMLQGTLGAIIGILSGALIVMGAVLLFSGANIGLGLGLIVVGALGLASALAANWETLITLLQGPIGAIVGILSGAFLVLGAVLLFSGANIALGLGLMLAGAVGLATAVAANWATVQTALQGPIGVIAAILSGALLIIGAIFTFSGANIPLGLGLMVVGAAGLATSIAANWEFLQTTLQGPIGALAGMISAALLVLGAILAFSGAALPLGIGLLVVGAAGLATSIAANWEYLTGVLGGSVNAVTSIVSAALLALGAILVFTGAGTALGLGMLVAGGAGLVTAIAPNWNFIQDAMSKAWSSFLGWWESGPAQFFSLDYWAGLAGDMLDGLFGGLENLGRRIADWGGGFIDGVKDFFGISSPSKEFESLGDYMMQGLQGGVSENYPLVVSAFSVMFNSVAALCTQTVTAMQVSLGVFLTYLTETFLVVWRDTWNDCYTFSARNIQGVIAEIDALNARLASIERNITITITTIYKTIGGGSSSSSSSRTSSSRTATASTRSLSMVNIPALARGAVIPPNREFLAVLGDQKQGTNIETPLSTMVQAFRTALSDMGYGGEQTVILQVDKEQLGKVVYKLNKAETRRIGVNLVGV